MTRDEALALGLTPRDLLKDAVVRALWGQYDPLGFDAVPPWDLQECKDGLLLSIAGKSFHFRDDLPIDGRLAASVRKIVGDIVVEKAVAAGRKLIELEEQEAADEAALTEAAAILSATVSRLEKSLPPPPVERFNDHPVVAAARRLLIEEALEAGERIRRKCGFPKPDYWAELEAMRTPRRAQKSWSLAELTRPDPPEFITDEDEIDERIDELEAWAADVNLFAGSY